MQDVCGYGENVGAVDCEKENTDLISSTKKESRVPSRGGGRGERGTKRVSKRKTSPKFPSNGVKIWRYFPKVKEPDKVIEVQRVFIPGSQGLQQNISMGEGKEKHKLLGKQE